MRTVLFLCLLPLALGDIKDPVDLTKQLVENTVYNTGASKFNHTQTKEGDGFLVATKEIEASKHGGTHMDAPFHFNKKGWRIGEIPFQRFFGKGKTYFDNFTEHSLCLPSSKQYTKPSAIGNIYSD